MTIEYRIELGNTFHTFSNGRWWTPDLAEAERDLRRYRNPDARIEEWRNGEFYRIVQRKVA